MTALKIIACIVLFFAFILSIKATVTVSYSDTLHVSVRVLFVKINVFPKKKARGPFSMSKKDAARIKEKKREKERKRLLKKQKRKQEHEGEKSKKSLSDILDMLRDIKEIATAVTKKFFGHLRVKVHHLSITVATGDAATTAMAYTAVYSAAYALFEILEPVDNVKLPERQNVFITTDYLGDQMSADVKISFSLRIWHALSVGLAALFKLIGQKIRNQK